MNRSRPVLLSRSWLLLSLSVGFMLAAGTAILSSISTRDLALSSARLDERLAQLHQRIEASNAREPRTADRATTEAEQRELSRLAHDSSAVTRRAEFFQRISVGLLVAACALGTAGAVLLRRRIRQFEDMITVCAWTKRVRFNDSWVSFEDYLHARFNLQFTHGISEEAAEKIRKDTADIVKAEAETLDPASANVT